MTQVSQVSQVSSQVSLGQGGAGWGSLGQRVGRGGIVHSPLVPAQHVSSEDDHEVVVKRSGAGGAGGERSAYHEGLKKVDEGP